MLGWMDSSGSPVVSCACRFFAGGFFTDAQCNGVELEMSLISKTQVLSSEARLYNLTEHGV